MRSGAPPPTVDPDAPPPDVAGVMLRPPTPPATRLLFPPSQAAAARRRVRRIELLLAHRHKVAVELPNAQLERLSEAPLPSPLGAAAQQRRLLPQPPATPASA